MVCVVCVWCIIYAAPPVAKSTTEARPGCATSASKEMLWVMRRVLSSLALPLNFFLISLSAVPTALCCYLGDQPTSWAHPTVLHHWIPATGNACTATTVYITVLQTFFTYSSLSLPPRHLHLSLISFSRLLHTLFLSAFRCCPHHLPLCCGYLPGWRKPSSSQGIILMVVTTESVLYVWASFWLLFTVNLNTCINSVYLYKCNTHCQCLRVSVVDYNQELTFLLHRSLSSSLWACFHPLPSLASSPLAEWWANFKSFLLLGQSQGSECSRTSESLLIQKTMFMTVLLCINFWSLVQS